MYNLYWTRSLSTRVHLKHNVDISPHFAHIKFSKKSSIVRFITLGISTNNMPAEPISMHNFAHY